ncbi:MAG: HEAT repeat domain-containing protein, partial [Prevotellaceae bacterium]|nr:HEAT repeat domain-containing protein [Prevotellaceae bacterium]
MKRYISQALMLLAMPLAAEANSFAIVIDSKTLNHTRDAVVAYSNAVEHDGLKTYIIAADWQTPHQVRDSLSTLYQRDPMLEGCVFVGDIPVAM